MFSAAIGSAPRRKAFRRPPAQARTAPSRSSPASANKFDPAALAQAILAPGASSCAAGIGRFSMTLPQDITNLQSEMRAAVREHWKAFLIEGILLVILGLAAMIVPPLASLAVTIFLGWMFLISGIAGLALTFWARQLPGFWWSLISAALAVAAGIILLAQPVQGTL